MIRRIYDYDLIGKMGKWDGRPPDSLSTIYLVADGLILFSFHPVEDGYRARSGFTLDGRGRWVAEYLREAISWVFRNTGARNIYAGCGVEYPRDSDILGEVGMDPVSAELVDGQYILTYQIENLIPAEHFEFSFF